MNDFGFYSKEVQQRKLEELARIVVDSFIERHTQGKLSKPLQSPIVRSPYLIGVEQIGDYYRKWFRELPELDELLTSPPRLTLRKIYGDNP